MSSARNAERYGTRPGTEVAPMRILIVEDEPRIREFLTRAFEAEGYAVTPAADGESGLRQAISGDHDLVVLDLLLPGRSGLDLLPEIRQYEPDLPVLVLSARSDLATRLRGFKLGAVDYMVKPFSLDELLARTRVHLRRPCLRVLDHNHDRRIRSRPSDSRGTVR